MVDLYKLESVVEDILNKIVSTRSDDQELYSIYTTCILKRVYPNDSDADFTNHFYQAMSNRQFRAIHGISEVGSVSRCRRKLQEKYDYLKPSEDALKARDELRKQYRKYARGEKK